MLLDVVVHEKIEFKTGEMGLDFERQMLNEEGIRATNQEVFSGSTELFTENPIEYARSKSMLDSACLTDNQRV